MDTLTLLGMPSEDATRVIVQDLLVSGVSVEDVEISESSPVEEGTRAAVEVYPAAATYMDTNWPYFGQTQIEYHRLDLHDTFGALGLVFEMPTPFTAAGVVERMHEVFGIVFEPEDFVDETITQNLPVQTYQLTARVNSPRWRGHVAIMIRRPRGTP